MLRPALFVLFTVLLVILAGSALAEDIAIPDLGRRGDLPDGLTAMFSSHLRQAVGRTGLSVDSAELVTEGIAGSLDPFYTALAGRLLGTRYAVSGEIVEGVDGRGRFTVNLLVVDTEDDRQSDVVTRPLQLRDAAATAEELAAEILAFTDIARSLPAGDAGLFVSSEPAGADVYVNGLLVGRTGSLHLLELLPGRYGIELRKDGYLPITRVEELRAGSTAFPHFRLTELRGGSAHVVSSPPAEVFHGGESLGFTPVTVPLPAGQQELLLRRDGFRDALVPVDVRNNRVTRVAMVLQAVREPLVYWNAGPGLRVEINDAVQNGTAAAGLRPGRVTFTVWQDGRRRDYTMVLPLTGVFELDTSLGALIPLD